MRGLLIAICISTVTLMLSMLLASQLAEGTQRPSCACTELRRIRVLLEQQAGVVCNEYRCLPAPTPTNDGGPLE